jgi:protease-4
MTRCIVLFALLACSAGCLPRSVTISLDDRGGKVRESTVFGQRSDPDKIAVIDIEGVIGSVPTGSGVSLDDLATMLERAENDRYVRGVLLRVNSPGGSVAASETLHGMIASFRKRSEKPVVVSMGEVAASGGYYIALAADKIVAQPSTITGSIGVIVPTVNASDGLDRIGIRSRSVTSGPNKDIANPLAPPQEAHYALLQVMVDEFYAQFRTLVLTSRPAVVDPDLTLDGRVVTGARALELGLVDLLGGIPEAAHTIEVLAGIDGARGVKYYRGSAKPYSPYARAESGNVPAQFSWLGFIERPLTGSGMYYLWMPPGTLAAP